MPTTIKYKGSIIAELGVGEFGTLPCNGKEMEDDITVIAPEGEGETVDTWDGTGIVIAPIEAEDALAGTWVFNDTPVLSATAFLARLSLVCGDTEYGGLGSNNYSIAFLSPDTFAYYEDTWDSEEYKTITINTPLSDVVFDNDTITPEEFIAWLQSNATKQ